MILKNDCQDGVKNLNKLILMIVITRLKKDSQEEVKNLKKLILIVVMKSNIKINWSMDKQILIVFKLQRIQKVKLKLCYKN